jgi:hypothetical protein
MPVNMVATADPAQFESERFDQPAEFGKPDIPEVSRNQSLPQSVSTRARHPAHLECDALRIFFDQ